MVHLGLVHLFLREILQGQLDLLDLRYPSDLDHLVYQVGLFLRGSLLNQRVHLYQEHQGFQGLPWYLLFQMGLPILALPVVQVGQDVLSLP